MYEKELQSLGLSDKESRVYLASLELGPETVQNIAKKAGVNRPTTYVQIELLKQKGLMSEVEKDKKTLFVAESPDRLSSLLNTYQQELEFKKAEIGRILPGLSELFQIAGERPKVRFFEGVEGMNALMEDFLKSKPESVQSVVNLDKLFETFPNYENQYSQKRIDRKVVTNVIYTRKNGPIENASDPAKFRVARYIAPEKFPISADMTIYGNKVGLFTYKTKAIFIIIENEEIASLFKGMFHAVWNSLSE